MLLLGAVGVLGVAASVWLTYEYWRFLWQPTHLGRIQIHPGGIDLAMRHSEVREWFQGLAMHYPRRSGYPPASYALLWPFMGWLSLEVCRWLWAVMMLGALAGLSAVAMLQSRADTVLEKLFIGLFPPAMYAAGATIGNGQVTIYVLLCLICGLLLVRERKGWLSDGLGALLLLFSLVKPSVSAPFFWIVLFASGRLGPAVTVVLGYAILTAWASAYQDQGILTLFREWIIASSHDVTQAGTANVHIWLGRMGLEALVAPVSASLLLLLGLWVYFHRRIDLWVLVGLSALIARFWTYHRWYDDLLLLFPVLCLYRLAKREEGHGCMRQWSTALLALNMPLLVAPGGLYLLPSPWDAYFVWLQTGAWLACLLFLLIRARQERLGRPS